MKFQFFTVSVIAAEQDQGRLNQFCEQHRVVSVEKQFIAQGDNSFWSICVCYIDDREIVDSNLSKKTGKHGRIDYKEVLSEQDFVIYAELRNLRKTLAEREGIPVYAVFTNEQLAEMVTHQVSTLTDLAKIAGVGKARMDKYGDHYIAELNRLFTTISTINETLPD